MSDRAAGKHSAPNDFMVVLTGAGISATSGIPTFRSNGGLWRTYRFQDLATPEAFRRQPELVWEFYRWRQEGVFKAQPNLGHELLRRFETQLGPSRFMLVTQNVDNLHERAGSKDVWHMHGDISKARCSGCGQVLVNFDYADAATTIHCPHCRAGRTLRPHIVWFGEQPFHLEEIQSALRRATVFLAIGTSGTVYPAAQFVNWARQAGALTFLINLDPAENGAGFHGFLSGSAEAVLAQIWGEGREDLFGYFRRRSG